MEELADYSQRFARANLTQQEVDVYLDNIEGKDTEGVLAEAPDMEPGRKDRTEDGVELTHTVEGMQVSLLAESLSVPCTDQAKTVRSPPML